MWKGWINLMTAFWLILSGMVPDLQNSSNLVAMGIIMIFTGFAKIRTWHDLAIGGLGIGLIFFGLISPVPSFFVIAGILLVVLAILVIKNNVPDLEKNN